MSDLITRARQVNLANASSARNNWTIDPTIIEPQSAEALAAWQQFVTAELDLSGLRKLTNTPFPVLLLGETGTGKEVIARALHGDRDGQFVVFNCATVSEQLVSATLFGYAKGAYTGAIKNQRGLIDLAAGGTLFIDELGSASFATQAHFLRLIENREYYPVGDNVLRYSMARILLGTSSPRSAILPDLLGRITFVQKIPPLRNRPQDIRALVAHYAPELQALNIPWEQMAFPYNVRSLRAYIEQIRIYGTPIDELIPRIASDSQSDQSN